MNVLSLFDGMSCGQIALDQLRIRVDKYYASEIDKWAIQVTNKNYPDTIQLGDITKWREWDIDWVSIDLVYGGSPCQGFSFAGKQLAFDDPRSKLFFDFVDIVNHVKSVNPNVKFLLENVRMKKEHLAVIDEHMGVPGVMINSALVSAQNRVRYYWTNISELQQPQDSETFYSDIADQSDQVNSDSWHTWWSVVKDNQLKKKYSWILRNDSKAITMTARQISSWNGNLVSIGDKLRFITPIEAERLQTVPDGYTDNVSNTQRYRMLGNGWTVEVIKHIFKDLV